MSARGDGGGGPPRGRAASFRRQERFSRPTGLAALGVQPQPGDSGAIRAREVTPAAGTSLAPLPGAVTTDEEPTVHDDNPAASTAQDLKAAARDALRLGSRWAHSALDWLDERRNDMTHRTDRDFDHRDRARSAYGPDDVDRGEGHGRMHRHTGGRREERSDLDIQSDYSGGGYDQVAGYRSGEDWYQRGGGYGGDAQWRTRSPDDDSLRGGYRQGEDYGGAGYGYGAAGAGGVGYGAPGYGAGRGYGAGNYDYDSGPMRDESRGFSGYDYNRGYDAAGGSNDFSRQGRHGLEGYGQAQRGPRGQRDFRARGSAGQGYGQQGYGAQGYGAQHQDYRAQGYGYGSQGGQQHSQASRQGRSYRGMGPRNYTRSDERIREDLNERLTDAHDIDASGLSVEVNNGVVTLTGSVDQRWMKHRAEDIADSCSGVRDVRNQIQVQREGAQSQGMQSPGRGSGSGAGAYGGTGMGASSGTSGSSGMGASSGTSGGGMGSSGSGHMGSTGAGQGRGTTSGSSGSQYGASGSSQTGAGSSSSGSSTSGGSGTHNA